MVKTKPSAAVVLAEMDAEIAAIETEQEAEYADYIELHDRARQRGQKTCEEAVNDELIKTSSKEGSRRQQRR